MLYYKIRKICAFADHGGARAKNPCILLDGMLKTEEDYVKGRENLGDEF